MGPAKYRGIGWDRAAAGGVNAPPVAPGNGSGGAGSISLMSNGDPIAPIKGEISDLLAGRITLGFVSISVLVLVGFYVYTRGIQNGA